MRGKKTNQQIKLVTAIDTNYIYPLIVALFSANKHAEHLKMWSIAYDPETLSVGDREKIGRILYSLGIQHEFISLSIDPSWPNDGHITKIAFAKVLLPSVLKTNFIWFDVDILFQSKWEELIPNITELLEHQLVCARPEQLSKLQVDSSSNEAVIKSKDAYFNTGILGVNIKEWSLRIATAEVSGLVSEYSLHGFQWKDQDIYNFLIGNEYGKLSDEYNYFVGRDKNFKSAKILHFLGSDKPWKRRLGTTRFWKLFFVRFTINEFKLYQATELMLMKALKDIDGSLVREVKKLRRVIK
jgi:lipopolysaccharide biosynthesis glycosyltransferase